MAGRNLAALTRGRAGFERRQAMRNEALGGVRTPPVGSPPSSEFEDDDTLMQARPFTPDAFIFHHTSGRGTVDGVRATLRERGLGVQYVMDRDGSITKIGETGASHAMPERKFRDSPILGEGKPFLSNANTFGMEVIGLDNGDITPAQVASARKFITENFPDTPVFGHGEINPGHKEADEGMAIVKAIRESRSPRAGTSNQSRPASVARTSEPVDIGEQFASGGAAPGRVADALATPPQLAQARTQGRNLAAATPPGESVIEPVYAHPDDPQAFTRLRPDGKVEQVPVDHVSIPAEEAQDRQADRKAMAVSQAQALPAPKRAGRNLAALIRSSSPPQTQAVAAPAAPVAPPVIAAPPQAAQAQAATPAAMAASMVRLDGSGPLRYGSTAEDKLIREAGYDPKVIKASGLYKPGRLLELQSSPPTGGIMDWLKDSPVGAALRGVEDVGEAMAQIGARGFGSDADAAYVELGNKIREDNYRRNWRQGRELGTDIPFLGKVELSRALGSALVPLPGIAAASKAAAATTGMRGILARFGLAAAGTGLTSPIRDTSPNVGSADDTFKSRKAGEMALGGVLGRVADNAVQKIAVPMARNIGRSWANKLHPDTDALFAHADRNGRDLGRHLTVGDATGSPKIREAEVLAEKLPFSGAEQIRADGQEAVARAIPMESERIFQEMMDTPFRGLKEIRDIAATRGHRRQPAARALLEAAETYPSDWNRTTQTSAWLSMLRKQLRSDRIYQHLEKVADEIGPVPPDDLLSSIDGLIANEARSPRPDPSVKTILSDYSKWLEAEPRIYSDLGRLRSNVMKELQAFKRGANGAVTESGAEALSAFKQILEQQMEDFAVTSSNPLVSRIGKAAARYYKTQVVPYKAQGLVSAMKNETPDKVIKGFIEAGSIDQAQRFYNALEPRGQAAVRFWIANKAAEKARTNISAGATTAAEGIISPAMYAKYIKDIQKGYGVFFKGHDKWVMDGFVNVLEHLRRVGQYGEAPSTGYRTLMQSIVSGAIGGGSAAGSGGAGLGAVAGTLAVPLMGRLFMSPSGKRLFMAAADRDPMSPSVKRIAHKLGVLATSMTASASGKKPQRDVGTQKQEPR